MENRLKGCAGVKILIVTLIYLFAALIVDQKLAPMFRIVPDKSILLNALGIIILTLGLFADFAALSAMRRARDEGRLATTGLYRIVHDPMYMSQIFLILPGAMLIVNSWLGLTTMIPAYLAYKVFTRKEHRVLRETFGQAYTEYEKTILIPFL